MVVIVVAKAIATATTAIAIATAATTTADFKLSNPEMCMYFVFVCILTSYFPTAPHPFHISLSPWLIYSSIQLYLQPNQTVNCSKQENFTINHCRTQSLLFEIH